MGKKSKGKKSKKSIQKALKKASQPTYVPPLPTRGATAGSLPASELANDAVPSSSSLLAYKLLKDSAGGNSAVFEDMLQNELKYLYGGIALLKNDAKISQAMGGETMANAAKLASILKSKTKEIDFNDRIENIASNILYHDYAKPGKRGLMPNNIPPSVLQRGANNTVRLDYRVAGATGFDVGVNRQGANVPPIRQVPFLAHGGVQPAFNNLGNAPHADWIAAGAIVDAHGNVRQRNANPLTGFRF